MDFEDNLVMELVTWVELKEQSSVLKIDLGDWWQQKAALQLVPPCHSSCQLEDQGQDDTEEKKETGQRLCGKKEQPVAYLFCCDPVPTE